MRFESGDQSGVCSPAVVVVVSACWPLPSLFIAQMSDGLLRVYAIWPLDAQAGADSAATLAAVQVRSVGVPPPALMTRISPSVVYAIFVPSGDQVGCTPVPSWLVQGGPGSVVAGPGVRFCGFAPLASMTQMS